MGEALNILEGFDLGTVPREQGFHDFLEASAVAFADGELLARPYGARRRSWKITKSTENLAEADDPPPVDLGVAAADLCQALAVDLDALADLHRVTSLQTVQSAGCHREPAATVLLKRSNSTDGR